MHIKARLYPYPVLASFNDDYINSSFNIAINAQVLPNEIIVRFKPDLKNEQLQQLIDENKACFLIHIESSLTSYRKIIQIKTFETAYRIPAEMVEGVITFCPFIVAMEEISEYSNSDFNVIYEGISFSLDKGNIMAVGQEVQIEIEKENDNLANIPSIFAVTELKDKDAHEIKIDNYSNKINIQLPSETFVKFKLAMANANTLPIIHAVIIIPALMKCFDDMKSRNDEFYIFENKRWFKAIVKALKKFNIDLNEDSILSIDSFEVCQKLIDNTTNKAILSINEIAFQGGNDED